MSPLPFLDTHVILRHILSDSVDLSPKATAYIARIETEAIRVRIADTGVFETVFTLEKHYRHSRPTIRCAVQPILDLPGIVLPGKRWFRYAFDLWVNHPAFSFADCYHASVMRRLGLQELISCDRALDRLPHLTRIEPT